MMKTKTLALLFGTLLIFSLIFASCNDQTGLSDKNNNSQGSSNNTVSIYETMIRDLEDQIIELQQSQYISNAENQKELLRLQNLLSELKSQLPDPDNKKDPDDSKDTDGTDDPDDPTPSTPPSSDPENPSSALFSYIRRNNEITITGYSGEEERLVIPSKIDGYAVTAIGDDAFVSDKIKEVVIPDGVTKIGWFAFQKCASLTSVTIPSSVTGIGYSAFPTATKSITIYCHKDSFAQKYAQSYGISFAII